MVASQYESELGSGSGGYKYGLLLVTMQMVLEAGQDRPQPSERDWVVEMMESSHSTDRERPEGAIALEHCYLRVSQNKLI